jgi:hypothetical protein
VDFRRLHVAVCPKEIDETAYIDGYSFPRFFMKHLHAADRVRRRRRSVFLLHVLVGRTAAVARTLTTCECQIDRRDQ